MPRLRARYGWRPVCAADTQRGAANAIAPRGVIGGRADAPWRGGAYLAAHPAAGYRAQKGTRGGGWCIHVRRHERSARERSRLANRANTTMRCAAL